MKIIRSLLSLLLALTMVLAVAVVPVLAAGVVGDASGEGMVNNVDAMLILQHAVGLKPLDENAKAACDVDGDGTINNVDAMLVLQYAVGLRTKFPVEDAPAEDSDHQHSYERKVTAEPTCYNEGEATYTCSCGASYTESIAAEHDYECTDIRPATCSNPGDKTYTCKTCGNSYKETLPKNEHRWSEWVVTVEPTATTYGKKIRTCELCYGGQEANIDPITAEEGHEHSYTAHVMAPTCEMNGYTTYTCSCGHAYTGDETAPTGHTFETETIPPTADAQGYDLHICTKCGLDYVDNITDKLPADDGGNENDNSGETVTWTKS